MARNFFIVRAIESVAMSAEGIKVRGMGMTSYAHASFIRNLLDDGYMKMVKIDESIPALDNAEEVFDAVNQTGALTDSGAYMTVGDVIIWCNGKRELCLQRGWVTI